MSCPFAGLATRSTVTDERVSVRICCAVPYERDSDPEELPLPSVCFSQTAWQACPHYLRLTQRREVALALGLALPDEPALDDRGAPARPLAVLAPATGRGERRRSPLRRAAL